MNDLKGKITGNEINEHHWLKELQAHAHDLHSHTKGEPRPTRDEAITRGITATQRIAKHILAEAPLDQVDPGHGSGHHLRDYTHAILLAMTIEDDVDTRHIVPAIVGAVAHDFGCLYFRRYDDGVSAVKHAGAGAILLREAFAQDDCGLSLHERRLAIYAVAAHTHYLKPLTTKGADGVERTLDPYPDMDAEGKPLFPVWFTRWVDRLDCNGPSFVGRHYLTLVTAHADYLDGTFHDNTFERMMRPLLRTREERAASKDSAPTMLEHLHTFAASQTSESPYGKHDSPGMQAFRDQQTARSMRIIQAVQNATPYQNPQAREQALKTWTEFCATIVEPHPKVGGPAAHTLADHFVQLPTSSQDAWLRGFEQTIVEHEDYLATIGPTLETLAASKKTAHALQFMGKDLRDALGIKRPA